MNMQHRGTHNSYVIASERTPRDRMLPRSSEGREERACGALGYLNKHRT